MRLSAALSFTLLLAGCYASHGREAVLDAGPGDSGCVRLPPGDAGTIRPERVDLLFMVDNSNSMTEEQASLAMALPDLVRAVSSGDVDLDGVTDFAPVESLQLGVVTSDMGTGGFRVPTCARSDFGDDGVLLTRGNPELADCDRTYPPFLEYRPGDGDDLERFASDAACLTTAGTGGCGFEQQLEAVLKAVTPSSSPVTFFQGSQGHGDGDNAGFVRDDSVLAIIVVTDENDCSALDPELFNPSSSRYRTDLNLRCVDDPAITGVEESALQPVTRYVDGLLALRRDLPGRLVFASIVGVPPDLSGATEDRALADPRVQEEPDPTNPTRLVPSCDVPGRGVAFPPTRILETSRGIRERGGRSVVLSICVEDFSPAVQLILDEIAAAARPICR